MSKIKIYTKSNLEKKFLTAMLLGSLTAASFFVPARTYSATAYAATVNTDYSANTASAEDDDDLSDPYGDPKTEEGKSYMSKVEAEILEAIPGKKKVKLELAINTEYESYARLVDGYEVQYSLKKNFADAKTISIKDSSKENVTIKKLKSGTQYFFRARVYQLLDADDESSASFSKWSSKVKATVM